MTLWDKVCSVAGTAALRAKLNTDLMLIDRELLARKQKFGVELYDYVSPLSKNQSFYTSDDTLTLTLQPPLIAAQQQQQQQQQQQFALQQQAYPPPPQPQMMNRQPPGQPQPVLHNNLFAGVVPGAAPIPAAPMPTSTGPFGAPAEDDLFSAFAAPTPAPQSAFANNTHHDPFADQFTPPPMTATAAPPAPVQQAGYVDPFSGL